MEFCGGFGLSVSDEVMVFVSNFFPKGSKAWCSYWMMVRTAFGYKKIADSDFEWSMWEYMFQVFGVEEWGEGIGSHALWMS